MQTLEANAQLEKVTNKLSETQGELKINAEQIEDLASQNSRLEDNSKKAQTPTISTGTAGRAATVLEGQSN